jgi:phosphinothricin acetyltransferase
MSGPPAGVLIRPMLATDAPAVLAIYQAGLDEGHASFETTAPDWPEFDASRLPGLQFVAAAAVSGGVTGWVAARRVSARHAYRGVAEHSVYVSADARGRGAGLALLHALITAADAAGIWTIESAIFPENTASLAVHARAGFRVVGIRERIGRHRGRWRDTVLVERRSTAI